MTDLIAELNQALYLATPAERRAFMSALLPTISRWLTESVESCAEASEDERQWPDVVAAQLIEPVSATIRRVKGAGPAPERGAPWASDPVGTNERS
ncbi:hypothetical protein [Jiangella asiatica]|uniref:Uncharacterized protein n=1 Tax=Jiangella asiatica TaxID=2530372 RepID=A0A4R5DCI3_9ACTN|nr:hypothetical protein [Jiangella asiatica]TDE09710.1 hypothetical protein E1269_13895 [Jiangella asiatica]